ncbi:hypothetical protein M3Y95_00185200 [Aphelenchoides besseyi]|nr:hypothetical protein M3Y95_00185200 [Aphelenchoides besseyi]
MLIRLLFLFSFSFIAIDCTSEEDRSKEVRDRSKEVRDRSTEDEDRFPHHFPANWFGKHYPTRPEEYRPKFYEGDHQHRPFHPPSRYGHRSFARPRPSEEYDSYEYPRNRPSWNKNFDYEADRKRKLLTDNSEEEHQRPKSVESERRESSKKKQSSEEGSMEITEAITQRYPTHPTDGADNLHLTGYAEKQNFTKDNEQPKKVDEQEKISDLNSTDKPENQPKDRNETEASGYDGFLVSKPNVERQREENDQVRASQGSSRSKSENTKTS